MTKRHRWRATADHFYSGPKYWVCKDCGLRRVTEYDEDTRYSEGDGGRTWRRYAPPCPPPPVEVDA